MTHRLDLARADGLRARTKASPMIRQTEAQSKIGGIDHVVEKEEN
jgi:hypothetical protein